jgi:mono/diheme cytochrome c family protein
MTTLTRPMAAAAAALLALLTMPLGGAATPTLDVPPASGAATDGKQIFLDQKCNMCHTVSSASITPTSKIKAPDLTGLASKEDPAFVKKYLKKEADKNGKKHIKPFSGTDAQLDALVSWLQKQTKADTK